MTTTVSAARQIRDERRARIHQWFKDHRATLSTFMAPDGRTLESLRWQKPGTSIYRLDYLCDGPHLIVTGDLDDAIYEAGAEGLKWWSQCDLHYFHGKCIASPTGARPMDWDERKARDDIGYYLDEDEDEAQERRVAWNEWGGHEALRARDDWHEWLRDNASEVFGPNWPDCELWSVGDLIEQSVEAHLIGLKMALAQMASGGAP